MDPFLASDTRGLAWGLLRLPCRGEEADTGGRQLLLCRRAYRGHTDPIKAWVVSSIGADYYKVVKSHRFKLYSFGIFNKTMTELNLTFGLKRSL